MLETPVFQKLQEAKRVEQRPVTEVVRSSWREIVLSAFLRLPEQAPFYLFTVFVYTYGEHLKIARGGFEVLGWFEQVIERLELLDDFLCPLLIVPEVGLSHLGGELVALHGLGGEVKESPAAE